MKKEQLQAWAKLGARNANSVIFNPRGLQGTCNYRFEFGLGRALDAALRRKPKLELPLQYIPTLPLKSNLGL